MRSPYRPAIPCPHPLPSLRSPGPWRGSFSRSSTSRSRSPASRPMSPVRSSIGSSGLHPASSAPHRHTATHRRRAVLLLMAARRSMGRPWEQHHATPLGRLPTGLPGPAVGNSSHNRVRCCGTGRSTRGRRRARRRCPFRVGANQRPSSTAICISRPTPFTSMVAKGLSSRMPCFEVADEERLLRRRRARCRRSSASGRWCRRRRTQRVCQLVGGECSARHLDHRAELVVDVDARLVMHLAGFVFEGCPLARRARRRATPAES